jgi:hypothetical protein
MEKLTDIIVSIFKHYFHSQKEWYKRIFPIFFLLGAIYIVDYYLGFSYNLKTNYQLEQIEKIEKIVKETKDSCLIYNLKSIETDILNKKSITDYLSSFSFLKTSLSQSNENINNPIPTYNIFFHFLSSNLVLIILFYFVFFNKSSKDDGLILSFIKSFFSLLLIPILIFAAIFFFSGIFTYFFQPVSSNIGINILFNVSFQIIAILCCIAIYELRKKLKK